MKIRRYQVEERAALGATSSPAWDAAFDNYLADLDCPIIRSPSTLGEVVLWLLSFAVSLEYKDAADKYNQAAPAPVAEDALASSSCRSHTFSDLASAEVQQLVERLLQLAHVDAQHGLLPKQLEALRAAIGDEVLPTLSHASGPGTSGLAALQHLPLGFETGDAKVDAAATLLRLRFIQDLRALQSQIDGAIVAVQELTANPRTEASLGKVGH